MLTYSLLGYVIVHDGIHGPRYQNLTKFDTLRFLRKTCILKIHFPYIFSLYIDKNFTSPTIPGAYLDIFDGLVVMISACQDLYLNKRGRPGFDSPSERRFSFCQFCMPNNPLSFRPRFLGWCSKIEFLTLVLPGLQAYYSVEDGKRSEKGLKGLKGSSRWAEIVLLCA